MINEILFILSTANKKIQLLSQDYINVILNLFTRFN